MSASECQVLGCLWGNRLQNFHLEFPKMKLCEFVRVPTVSNWAKFVVQISQDEALTPVGHLFISVHPSCVHLATLKIHSVSRTPLNFEQRTSLEVVNSSGNEAISLVRFSFLFASARMLEWSVLADCYWAVWGHAVRKKSERWRVVWGKVG